METYIRDFESTTKLDYKIFNVDNLSKEEIQNLIHQSWIEIQNGLFQDMLCFFSDKLERTELTLFLKDIVLGIRNSSTFYWNTNHFVLSVGTNFVAFISFYNTNPYIISITENTNSADMSDFLSTQATVIEKIFFIDTLTYSINSLSNDAIQKLSTLSNTENLLVSTLSSEVLTAHGIPTVPPKVLLDYSFFDAENTSPHQTSRPINHELLFEDRIDVNSYNFFELVHPAYAKQTVEIIALLNQHYNEHSNIDEYIIDFGTGPGVPLLMLLQNMPSLKVHAVEPSPVAFSYLTKNLSSFSDRVKFEQNSFLSVSISTPVPIIMSVGASHHFNTYFLFQKANRLLKNDGILIISDEFISPYNCIKTRKLNLILHHTSYIKNLLLNLDNDLKKDIKKDLSPKEKKLIDFFENYIPMIIFIAQSGDVDKSVYLCEELYAETHKINLDNKLSNPIIAFYRLMLLELEALVTGIHYEVEQKTYVKRFIDMSKKNGFLLLSHKRIYSTYGEDDYDAGTHIFAFIKTSDIIGLTNDRDPISEIEKKNFFLKGVRESLPIAIGYTPIAITFGILGVQSGISIFYVTLMSIMVFAGATQFMSISMILSGASFYAIAISTFILNLRHIVMSISFLENIRPINPILNAFLSFFITDETFATISIKNNYSIKYLIGIMFSSYFAWIIGTILGANLSNIIPPDIGGVMSISLYVMFIGLLVPEIRKNYRLLLVIVPSSLMSQFFRLFFPIGWSIVLATFLGSFLGIRLHATIQKGTL